MIRFGIIGTNTITDNFLNAAKDCSDFKLNAIYSRKFETGQSFGEKYDINNIFTDLDEMITSKTIDAVYIASPNSIHFSQAKKFLENKIAVLCEKPLASNLKEVKELIELSKKHNTLLMEAIRTIHNPNYNIIKNNIHRLGKIRNVFGNFCQYSSRYDKYKEGIILNAFKTEFSNGSTMDIGLYPFYFVMGLFGFPTEYKSLGTMLESGVDGAGTALLKYPDFVAIINHSKINNSYIPSEIMGENGSIIIEKISLLEKITLKLKDGTTEELTVPRKENDMYYEISEFLKCYKEKKVESSENPHVRSIEVAEVMESSRKSIGTVFPTDN